MEKFLKSSRVCYISLVFQSIVSSPFSFCLHRFAENFMHEDEKFVQLPSAAKSSSEEEEVEGHKRQDYNISNKQSVFENVGVG